MNRVIHRGQARSLSARVPGFLLARAVVVIAWAAIILLNPEQVRAQCSEGWKTGDLLSGRDSHSMAYDSDRQRVVLFGGLNGNNGDGNNTVSNDTWEWDGAAWALRPVPPAHAPPARDGAAMAYDPIRHRTVLFGGALLDFADTFNDTWEWDGSQWTQMNPGGPSGPAKRGYSNAAFDASRGKVVLFGGFDGTNVFGETWEWTGTAWTPIAPSGPPGRAGHGMAYDAANARTLVFGGYNGSTTISDTWQLKAGAWTKLTTPNIPAARLTPGMTYDPGRDRVVLFGGASSVGDGATIFGDTWELNASTWTQVATTGVSPRQASALVYEASHSRVLLFGGNDASNEYADTWSWNGATWTQLVNIASPPERISTSMAYDAARGVSVLFGGIGASGVTGDTWTWNGSDWTQRAVPGPSARSGCSMTYDSARGRIVLCGGNGGPGDPPISDTWEWNGSTWTLANPSTPAISQVGPAMAYDAARAKTVLFSHAGATWLWDGSLWTNTGTTGPEPREQAAMAFDAARSRIVLFGGRSTLPGGALLNDTWEWNGTAWTLRATTTGPIARSQHNMVYDPTRGRVVLYGGFNGTDGQDDFWEWTGTAWTLITSEGPGPRFGAGASYDLARSRLVLFGGAGRPNEFPGFPSRGDTWEFSGTFTAPIIISNPDSQAVCPNGSASVSVTVSGPAAYHWRREGTRIDPATNPSASTSTLSLTNIQLADAGIYSCFITNADGCGIVTSNPATLAVRDCPYGSCPADYDASGGTPDSTDIEAYFLDWLLGTECADADCSGGTPDATDIEAFFFAWLAGGC